MGGGRGEEGKKRKGKAVLRDRKEEEGRGERAGCYLAVLLQVMVQDLGVRLLVRGQDVHEGGGRVGSSCGRIDGPPTSQGRRQVEGGGRSTGMETLFLKGLLSGRAGGGEKAGSANGGSGLLSPSCPTLGRRHAVTERTLRLEQDAQASASAPPFNAMWS